MEGNISSAYSWGKNKDGELSVGSNRDFFNPQAVKGMKNKQIEWISSGGQHSACIDSEGNIYICGSYLHGKLGIEDLTTISVVTFTAIKSLQGKKVKQVACGDYHTLCVLDDGAVYTWGGTLYNKLGHRSNTGRGSSKPGLVTNLKGKNIIYVDCGDFHSLALASDGKVYSWGGGGVHYNKGQCGHGHTNDIDDPMLITALKNKDIVQISCGGYHSLALTNNNELYSFGSGEHGECGCGEFLDTSLPQQVLFPWINKAKDDQYGDIIQISGGGHHTLALTTTGLVYSFGFASHGQLGLHNTTNSCTPQLVTDLRSQSIKCITAGWNHSLVLSSKGDVWACGYGFFGQLGLGNDESQTSFKHVKTLGNKNIKKIFAGGNHSWVVIDTSSPIREDYDVPSPLSEDQDSSGLSPSRFDAGLSFQNSVQSSPHSEYSITIIYSNIKFCHRFINYTLKEASLEIGKARAEEYVHEMYVIENGIQCHRIQEDDSIIELKDDIEEIICPGGQCFFTCALVCDPSKNIPSLNWTNSGEYTEKIVTKLSFQLLTNNTETVLSEWARFFIAKVGKHCKNIPSFFELRPFGFYNELT